MKLLISVTANTDKSILLSKGINSFKDLLMNKFKNINNILLSSQITKSSTKTICEFLQFKDNVKNNTLVQIKQYCIKKYYLVTLGRPNPKLGIKTKLVVKEILKFNGSPSS